MVRIGLLPADGIGKEVIPAAQRIVTAMLPDAKFVTLPAGFEHFQATKEALPQSTLDSLKTCDGALFGSVSSPSHKVAGYSSPIVALRKKLDLYANIRPVATPQGHSKPIDMLIIRENTECLYIKQETIETDANGMKTAYATRKITEFASKRIAKMAFEMALLRHKLRQTKPSIHSTPSVTIVHKSNVLSVTDGMVKINFRPFSRICA